jgi:hypothetical protein
LFFANFTRSVEADSFTSRRLARTLPLNTAWFLLSNSSIESASMSTLPPACWASACAGTEGNQGQAGCTRQKWAANGFITAGFPSMFW